MLSTKDALVYNVKKKFLDMYPEVINSSKYLTKRLRIISTNDLINMLYDENSLKKVFEEMELDPASSLSSSSTTSSIRPTNMAPSYVQINKTSEFNFKKFINNIYNGQSFDNTKHAVLNDSDVINRFKKLKFALSLWYSPEISHLLANSLAQNLTASEFEDAMCNRSLLFEKSRSLYLCMNL